MVTQDILFMEACDCAADLYNLRLSVLEKLDFLDKKTQVLSQISTSIPFEYYSEDGGSAANIQKKQGIIKRLWDAIINLFSSIKKFIFGSTLEKIDDNAEAEIPETWTQTSKITELGNKLKGMSKSTIVKTGILVLGAIAAVVGILKVTTGTNGSQTKTTRIKGSDAKKLAKIYGTNADTICKAAQQIENFDIDLAMVAGKTEQKDQAIRDKITALSNTEKAATGWKNRKVRQDLNAAKKEQNDVWVEFRKNIPPEIKKYMDVFGTSAQMPKDTGGLLAAIRSGLANVGKLLKDVAQQIATKFSTKGGR